MPDQTLVSPNDLLDAAKALMLDGHDPTSRDDWIKVVNFFAANIAGGVAQSACRLLRTIFDIPLTEVEVAEIVTFQLQNK